MTFLLPQKVYKYVILFLNLSFLYTYATFVAILSINRKVKCEIEVLKILIIF